MSDIQLMILRRMRMPLVVVIVPTRSPCSG